MTYQLINGKLNIKGEGYEADIIPSDILTLEEQAIAFDSEHISQKLIDPKKYFTDMTNSFIQARVDAYNAANGTAFNNVHHCESYSRVNGYTHQAFCISVWVWSVNVWETVRAYEATATAVPTDAEFMLILESVVYQ